MGCGPLFFCTSSPIVPLFMPMLHFILKCFFSTSYQYGNLKYSFRSGKKCEKGSEKKYFKWNTVDFVLKYISFEVQWSMFRSAYFAVMGLHCTSVWAYIGHHFAAFPTGADPENRRWGGHRDQRAISLRAPTCVVRIWMEDLEKVPCNWAVWGCSPR